MLQDSAHDKDELGEIGHFSDKIATDAMFWRLTSAVKYPRSVCALHMSPSEFDRLDPQRNALCQRLPQHATGFRTSLEQCGKGAETLQQDPIV